MNERRSHWTHFGVTFALTFLAASILLPLVRRQPEPVHQFLHELNDLVRISFVFALCVAFTGAMFKLLSPRIGHFSHCVAYPPSWLAAVVAWILVAVVDLSFGFDKDGYRATYWDWLGYGGGSILLVGFYSGLRLDLVRSFQTRPLSSGKAPEGITVQDIQNAPWEEVEEWLKNDEPARYDFLGNQSVAHRVCLLISDGARSIGIVGPYGAGKTSIVSWVEERLKRRSVDGKKFFVCHHSCWGFETSASAIQDMLGSAISKIGEEVDAFQVKSLPESYRQTFAAGGEWLEKISNIVLPSPDPREQFVRLSQLLQNVNGQLVFIVEDLDRNETQNFEIQEVLAFLERLKEYSNLSFILTGGLSSTQRIDYSKLCDHIEFLRTIEPEHSSKLIERVRVRCLDDKFFPHIRIVNPTCYSAWSAPVILSTQEDREFSLAQAVAVLLNTPRSLRHALGRTFSAWKTLHGEIDFNHLLAVNILRFGAPECFLFLMRQWGRLHSAPARRSASGQDGPDRVRMQVRDDWSRTIQNVEWNASAALQVMNFILPATECWLVNNSHRKQFPNDQQYVSEERYWIRALNEAIEEYEVRDQEVFRDVSAWFDTPNESSAMVVKLTSRPGYADLWNKIGKRFFSIRHEKILLLCEQVIRQILCKHGSRAGMSSLGFDSTWELASRWIGREPTMKPWLQDRITEAADISIEMVNGLWGRYGSPGLYSCLRSEDGKPVRQYILDTMRASVTDGASLVARLSPDTSDTLYHLVFTPGSDGERILTDVHTWAWLGPCILDALRSRNLIAAMNCYVLLSARVSNRMRMMADIEVLDEFFANDSPEVVDILESMLDLFPDQDRSLVKNIVATARNHFAADSKECDEDASGD